MMVVKVYWLHLLLFVLCGCPTMAVKSRKAKSWLQNNLVKDNVYVFPMTGIQVNFLKVIEPTITTEEEDDDQQQDVYYYNGEGNVEVRYSSKLVDGTIITPETQTILNSDTMIMGLWVRIKIYSMSNSFDFLNIYIISLFFLWNPPPPKKKKSFLSCCTLYWLYYTHD